jgi:hypothetical protein
MILLLYHGMKRIALIFYCKRNDFLKSGKGQAERGTLQKQKKALTKKAVRHIILPTLKIKPASKSSTSG